MKLSLCLFISLIFLFPSCSQNERDSLRVAVSANMFPAMEEISSAFEKEYGLSVDLIMASSGILSSQILEGAPYDIFISADTTYPFDIWHSGKAESKPKCYAKGSLAFFMRTNDKTAHSLSIAALMDSAVVLAIPNPEVAPYGRAAKEVLENLNIPVNREKLVYGENSSQVIQFVQSGAANYCISSKSHITIINDDSLLQFRALPDSLHGPILQSLVLLRSSERKAEAKRLEAFMFSQLAQSILINFGYSIPYELTEGRNKED